MSVCYYPCPCGYYGDPEREVHANCVRRLAGYGAQLAQRWRYQKRISGPLMDRFDIHIEVPRDDGLCEPQTS